MDAYALLEAATHFKQGLLAKASNGEYKDSHFQSDVAVLPSDQRLEKILPVSVQVN